MKKIIFSLNIVLLLSIINLLAFDLKKENTMKNSIQSSEFSFVLKPSPIAGIGVFAIHDIPKGAIVLTTEFRIRSLKTKDVPKELLHYCVYLNDEECLGPEHFDRMEIGWFINHSKTPNIARDFVEYATEELNSFKARPFIAIQDIKAGDEITVDYNYLAEPEALKEEYYRK